MILFRMFFVFEGLWWKFFGALEAWIHRVSPICGLLRFLESFELDSSGLWDLEIWFGWFLFECSLDSKVKVLEVFRGFKAWFQQSFWTSQSWCLSSLSLAFLLDLLKCLRKASIYRSLGVGKRHMAESDWWHMSQPDWSAYYVITYTHWFAYVIAYTWWIAYVIAYTHWCVIGFCMTLGKFLLVSE